ncbi:MAG: hypothetical protein QM530_02075 [Phycisphaerales bacterium]|nr:hypothetical protein [Phycisphaerales bacterium]
MFDEQNALAKLTQLDDPLVLVSEHVDFSLFKETILQFTGRVEAAQKQVKSNCAYWIK